MNQGLDLDLHLVSLVITGDVCQAEKKSGTLSDQESQLNPYRAKKFWMVGLQVEKISDHQERSYCPWNGVL